MTIISDFMDLDTHIIADLFEGLDQPPCEATWTCPDCDDTQPCGRTADTRLTFGCSDGCGNTVVLLLCTSCADRLEPGLTPPVTRRPL